MSLIELRNVTKSYGGLRPFRLRALDVEPGEFVAIAGVDHQAATVLTDLLTGTTLPDEGGSISIAGKATSAISSQDDWLAFLDRFGIVNDRVVLLDDLTVAANLAVPLTLAIDPMPVEARRAVEALAGEVGLPGACLDAPLREATALDRFRVRLGRAVALNPAILIVEHPTLDLSDRLDAAAAMEALRRVVNARQLAAIVAVADSRLSRGFATRHLTWQPTSGELSEAGRWRRWFT